MADRGLVQCLPAIDPPHGDLARRHQRPEQHGRGLRVGQGALGLDPALELPVQPFDGSTYTLTVVRKDLHCSGG